MSTLTQSTKRPTSMPIFTAKDILKGSMGDYGTSGTSLEAAANCASGKIRRLVGASYGTPFNDLSKRFVKAAVTLKPTIPGYNQYVVAINDGQLTKPQIALCLNAVIASLGYRKGQSAATLKLAAAL